MVEILTIGGIVSLCINLGLGLFVYAKNRERSVNKYFALFSISIAIWSGGSFLANTALGTSTALLVLRVCYIAAVFLPTFYLHFILHVVQMLNERKKIIAFSYVVSSILAVCLMTNMFLKGVREAKDGFLISDPGPIYYAFFFFLNACTLYGLYFLFKKIHESQGYVKTKLRWMFSAQIIAQIAGFEYFSAVFRWWDHIPFDDYILVGHFSIMSYAIVRHKLLDIEVIIKRTLVFAGLFSFVFGLFAFFSFVVTDILQRGVTPSLRWWLLAAATAVVALTVRKLESFLVNLTDKYLFQKKYNYHKLLRENSKQISTIQSLDEMAKQVVAFLITQGRIRNAGIFVQSFDQKRFELKYPLGYGGKAKRPTLSLGADHPLVQLLLERKAPLVLEDIGKEPAGAHKGRILNSSEFDLTEVLRIMKQLKAEVVIPSFLGAHSNGQGKGGSYQLKNLLILGPKKSDEEYTDEDLDVFFTIAQDSAIAAENARLFEAVLQEREAKIKAEHVAKRVKFARTIKHEVKNSLAGMEAPARFLSMYHVPDLKKAFNEKEEEWYTEICGRISKASQDILKGIDKVLDIAEASLGGMEIGDQPFRKMSFKVIWEDAKDSSGVRGCSYETTIPDGFSVCVRYGPFERVFENLIINANDAMWGQGEKTIRLNCSYQQIEGRQAAYFEFKDNGPGIPKEIQEKVFEQGFSTKSKPDDANLLATGYGQGLYVCKNNIETIHHGKLWVESAPGEGATFKFWIPAEPG